MFCPKSIIIQNQFYYYAFQIRLKLKPNGRIFDSKDQIAIAIVLIRKLTNIQGKVDNST